MGIDCEWCRYWRREYDYVCQARLKLQDEARLEKDLERGHAGDAEVSASDAPECSRHAAAIIANHKLGQKMLHFPLRAFQFPPVIDAARALRA
jgi:hypothetical protein